MKIDDKTTLDPSKTGGKPEYTKQKKNKSSRKPSKQAFRKEATKPYKCGPNDITWRTNDETMTRLVASLPFGRPAGLPIYHYTNLGLGNLSYTQPGIMVIGTLLTAGTAKDYNSPINLVGRKIYSYVRHANSGSKNYEAVDMTNYFISIGQILGLLGFCQRVLRTISEFSVTNRYTPRALLLLMGIDADDFMSNIPQLKYIISWLGKAIGSLAFPDLPYFRACYEAFQYIFKDNDSPKEQYYMLTPYEFGKYLPAYNSNGGGVTFDKNQMTTTIPALGSGTYMNFATLVSYIRERMDVLLGDEDCGIISGDILKAFGENLYKPAALNLDYELFQHSAEMLQQIHNLTVLDLSRLGLAGYKQNPGNVNTAPFLELDVTPTGTPFSSGKELCSGLVLDAFSREPDAKEVVNCTVLNPQVFLKSVTGGYNYDPDYLFFDLFLPVDCYICSDVTSATGSNVNGYVRKCGSNFTANTLPIAAWEYTNFDWHPLYFAIDASDRLHAVGDVQNIAFFDWVTAQKIHENSMLNLFSFKDHNFY